MLLRIFRVDVFEKGNFLPVTSLVHTVLTFCTMSLKFLISPGQQYLMNNCVVQMLYHSLDFVHVKH